MNPDRWKVPRTRAGLRTLLDRLEESRMAGDERAVGYGLLSLSWLVKWVPWDGEGSAFGRSADLVDEALAIFRRVDDERGTLDALTKTSPLGGAEIVEGRLREAESIADRLGDDLSRAAVLHARARATGLRDRAEAARLSREAAGLYDRNGRTMSAAACLFGVAIYEEDDDVRAVAALESAQRYREAGDRREAARAASLVLMFCDHWLADRLAPIVRQGLEDAIAGVDASLEALYWDHLAEVRAAEGDTLGALEATDRKARLAQDGLTPRQRRAQEVASLKEMIAMFRAMDHEEGAQRAEARLKESRRTRSSRPRPGQAA